MKGDFTRNTFNRQKRYSSVRMQQGRVQMDADWNEQVDILHHSERTTRIDVIGHCGGPQTNAGFEITLIDATTLGIGPGRYYVQGILCEKDVLERVDEQEDLPDYQLPSAAGTYLAYLDVWERHLTHLEDPEIRDVALGGPDTTTRAKVVAQVKLIKVDENATCADFDHPWMPPEAVSDGRLRARSQPTPPPDPCTVPAKAGYRRLENQLYRVEIHEPGILGDATFKWSRENGSVVFAVAGQDGGDKLVLKSPPPNLGLETGNLIELIDVDRELHSQAGVLMQVASIDGAEVTVDTTTISDSDPDNPMVGAIDLTVLGDNPKIRRWESAGALPVPANPDDFIPLEDGVEIQFDGASTSFFTGDYWQIPARANLGDVLWPEDPNDPGKPLFQPRHGVHHYYCPLAILSLDGEGVWSNPVDCRDLFPPLTNLPVGEAVEGTNCCCGISVGDGEFSQGDFSSLQEAVDAVVEAGGSGQICLLPGIHQLSAAVNITDMDLTIAGCGGRSLILGNGQAPAFEISGSTIHLADLAIQAFTPSSASVNLANCQPVLIEGCLIQNQPADGGQSAAPAVYLNACANVTVRDCLLIGLPAAVCLGTDLVLLENRMRGGGIWLEGGCEEVLVSGNDIRDGNLQGITLGGFRLSVGLDDAAVKHVAIRENRIKKMGQSAIGSAIPLPGFASLAMLYEVTIAHNELISCATQEPDATFNGQAMGGIILQGAAHVRIHANRIHGNGLGELPACGIYLSWAIGVEIADNQLTENGLLAEPGGSINADQLQGGIFLLPVLGGVVNPQGEPFIRPGQPAAQVHDNVVNTPSGPCLAGYGYGPMSIRDNTFTSRAACTQPPLTDDPTGDFGQQLFEGTCVSIFNLALNSRRETLSLPFGGGVSLDRDPLLGALLANVQSAEDSGPTPAGQLAYHDNQSDQHGSSLQADFADPTVVLVSFGDAAAQDNQGVCHMTVGQQLADWRVLAETTRVQNNWVDEEPDRTLFSIVAFGQRYCHASHNQVAECVYAAGGDVREVENQAFNADECQARMDQFVSHLPS